MEKTYYKLPLQLSNLFNDEDEQLERCSLLESIDQHLELLLTTSPGEHTFNAQFGTRIWELDFERVYSQSKWKERFSAFVQEAIEANEKRISEVDVKVFVREVVQEDTVLDSVTIRKRVDIYVYGVLTESNQRCGFNYSLYLGPLSNE
ncbi:GPW/gp25 family protein [Saccharicrinis fermentans]|uniref:Type VI secretion system lysozyme-like protein n=1 Tax=Saccharicrinis fermentans DSM 9555 = JCM 21142 TaxID=869213 RepID=W7Y339_9BACT|nr:GPW/gp25 family protein [Saccharicrinis fermentans]GAF05250.1 type VI secretion system lysozyme-like protein [Saccharicrinis fermentans DSM 9555 = JCM 21142]